MASGQVGSEHDVSTLKDSMAELYKRQNMSLPLTPLIDVTFMLLLYFLLTSTFKQPEQQMMAPLPAPGGKQSVLMPIHITLRPTGSMDTGVQYQIGEDEATGDLSDVRATLDARARAISDLEVPVVIHADEEVRWNYVVEAFNAASTAGFEAITFAPVGEEYGSE